MIKKFAKTAASLLLAASAFALAGGITACGGKSQETARPTNVDITKTEAPSDGSLPTAHSAAENLAYVAYVLENQPKYHCYTYTVTNAAIATQYTKSYKDYKDGVTISSDITYSSMVKSGSQALFVNGENGQEAYMRFSAAPKAETDHLNAEWSQDAPVHFSEQAYLYTYGLFQTELTNYIINADTIIESDEIAVNGDGTYTQSVVLDPQASTYYYQYGMKTRGGLGGYPEFRSIELSVTFDSAWRVTALDINEVALVNKGVTVTSKSVSRAEYSYDDNSFDSAHFAFYDSYFKQYVGSAGLEEGGETEQEFVVDVTNVLSNGFSRIMNGGQQFAVKARLGGNNYVGYIFLGLALEDPLDTLEARISLGQTLENQQLYVEYKDGEARAYYGEDFALTFNIAAVKPHIEALSQWLDSLNSVFGGAVGTEESAVLSTDEEEDALSALLKSIRLESTDSQAVLTLVTDDLLGLGVGLDVSMSFGIYGNEITFRNAEVRDVSIGGASVDMALNLSSTTADVISREDTGANADFADYVADVYKLLSSDLLKVSLTLDGDGENVKISGLKGLNVSADAYVDIDGVTVGADVDLSYSYGNNTFTASVSAFYDYVPQSDNYGRLIVRLNSVNGVQTDVRVCCEVSELADAIAALMQAAGVQTNALVPSEPGFDSGLVGIINGALGADFSSLISGVYADRAQIKVSVDVDEVLSAFGVDAGVEFGKCNLVYATGNQNGGKLSASLPAIGFALEVCGESGTISLPDTQDCLELTELINFVTEALENRTFEISISFDGAEIAGVDLTGITANATAYVNLGDTPWAYATVSASYTYENNTIDLVLAAYYEYSDGRNDVYLTLNRIGTLEPDFAVYCEVGEISSAVQNLLAYFNADQMVVPGIALNTADVIAAMLSADFATLIPQLTANGNGLETIVNLDEVLSVLGAELGVSLGEAEFVYSTADKNVTVTLPDLGLGMVASVSGAEKPAMPESALNLTELISLVTEALENRTFEISISFDGADIGGVDLTGITANATAYVNLGDAPWAHATVSASYTYEENTIDLVLAAYYEYSDGRNDVYLELKEFNGVHTDIAVYCEVGEITAAVEQLIALINGETAPTAEDGARYEESAKVTGVIAALLSADLNSLVTELTANAEGLKVTLNLDEVLALFVDNFGIALGEVTLSYAPAKTEGEITVPATLSGVLPEFGISLTANLSKAAKPVMPANALDLSALINTVNAAYGQIKEIIDGQSVYFEIDSGDVYISVDGITAGVYGSGEVVWKEGCESVALDLAVYIAENGGSDVANVKIVYDKNATDKPMIVLALNNVAIEIYRDDIDGFRRDFDNLYNTICAAFGISAGGSQVSAAALSEGAESGNDKLFAMLFGVLATNDWVEILNNFTLSSDGKSVALNGLVSTLNDKYDVALSVSTDGAFTLEYSAADYDNSNAFATGGRISLYAARPVCDGYDSLARALRAQICANNGFVVSSTANGDTPSFSKIVYEYLFDAFDSLSFDNILGTNTYGVEFLLDGNSCNVPALGGVYINANLYFTGRTKDTGNITDEARLTEADVNLDVNGVAITINVVLDRVGGTTYMYINLNRVADVYLPDLKVVATEDDIYNVLEEIINALTGTNVIEFIGGMTGGGTATAAAALSDSPVDEETKSALADIITKILKLNFSDKLYSVETSAASGQKITTIYLDIDELLRQLEIDVGYGIGRAEAVINRENHSMVTNVKAEVLQPDNTCKTMTWLSLASKHESLRDYSQFDKTRYIDVSFLSTLISDAVKTLTDDNGEIYEKFTFTGDIAAEVVGILTVDIDNVTLTLGIDGDGGFYFSFMGYINGSMVTNRWIGITYQGGYLTLTRGLDGTPEYKVMTMEYFIDNIFSKGDNSTINWLLGASDWIWNTVVGFIPSDVKASCDSGLFRTKDLYLYDYQAASEEKAVSIYDYIDALKVIINGATSAEINNTSDISSLENKLGVYDNYYGVDLNAALITGDVLTELYAAILRDDTVGISGIKAYGDISGYVNFLADFTYAEGVTENYVTGSGEPATGSVAAPGFFAAIRDDFEAALARTTFTSKQVFGCYVSKTDSVEISQTLERFTLTVHGLDGTDAMYEVREGSNVYLYENKIYLLDGTDTFTVSNGERLAYVDKDGNLIKTIENFSADTEVWAKNFAPATITIYNNGEKYAVIPSFVGDFMPTEVSGYTVLEQLCDENGVPASELGYVRGDVSLYGVFAQTQVEVNSVKYTLTEENEEYVYHASGKGALFNDVYCTNGKTLVLENRIGNFNVTAIEPGAFANTDGYCLKNVIVPANIVAVGENAFLDNVGMESVIFFAPQVTMSGSSGEGNSDNTTPFYGCSSTEGGNSTNLVIYYNTVVFEGSVTNNYWTKFRRSGSGAIYHRYYVGVDPDGSPLVDYDHNGGGAIYSAGKWQYVDYAFTLDTSASENGALSQGAIEKLLSANYGFVYNDVFEGSAKAAEIEGRVAVALSEYNFTSGDYLYKCAYTLTYETIDGKLFANYDIYYTVARVVYVCSPISFVFYGTAVAADTLTEVVVDASVTEFDVPLSSTHVFLSWSESEQNGKSVLTAIWREKYSYTFTCTVKGNISNTITATYADGSTESKKTSGYLMNYSTSFSFTVTEGQVVTARNDGSYIYIYLDGVLTYSLNSKSYTFKDADYNSGAVSGDISRTFNY